MKQFLLLCISLLNLLFFVFPSQVMAQLPPYNTHSAFLDINDVSAAFNSGGDLSWDLLGDPRYEVPKSSGKHALFAGNLWIGGLDGSGQLHMAAQTYRQSGIDMWPGPVADSYDSAYFARYNHVWKVSATEVLTHQSSVGQSGYIIPDDIKSWPGNGDTANGEPFFLAPFEDVNQNLIYEPDSGDYPLFLGDQVLYMISNDMAAFHTETFGAALGADIHLMAYAYDTIASSALDQSIFLSYRIVNRDTQALSEMMAGLWLDFDLGKYNDDHIGCDTMREAYFVYNADPVDDGPFGYGETPPAFGATMLNQSMSYFRTYNNDFSTYGNPEVASDYYGFLKNYWKDSTVLTIGGTGNQGSVPINYAYPGDVSDSSQWSEISAGNPTNRDKRGLGSAGPIVFMPGEILCLDIALVYGRADSGNHLSSVPVLLDAIDEVRTFYAASEEACDLYREEQEMVSIADIPAPIVVDLYPNPAQDMITLKLAEVGAQVRIMDVQGRILVNEMWKNSDEKSFSLREWKSGFYLVHIQKGDRSWTGKFSKL